MTTARIVSTAAALALAACALPPRAAPGAPAHRAPAMKGIELGDLDRSADPCNDFYQFANGTWRAANPIPTGASRWSRRAAAQELNRQQLQSLLEELAASSHLEAGTIEQQLGDHFASCMDEAAIDAAGVRPLDPLLADIAGVKDVASVERVIRRLHELAVPVPFTVSGAQDHDDPAKVIVNISAPAAGLPDRDHYLKPELAEAREKYRAHVAAVLGLGGMAPASARDAAGEILALETRFAEARLDAAAEADPAATAHKMTFEELARLAPRPDWERYFAEAGLPRTEVNVAEPELLKRIGRELDATPVAAWKAYLTWHLLESASPWLSRRFVDESDRFRGSDPRPRAAHCLESTEALLGEPLGRKYAERYFVPEAKAKVQEIVRNDLAELSSEVAGLEWMAPATREQALAKIAAYDVRVGYPDVWTDTSSLVIRRDAFWANVAAARRFGVASDRRRAGQRVSRDIWQLPPSSTGAYIDIQLNQMVLPAGFLQAPAFDLAASDAVNYGAIGISAAHDLTHAIDAGGAGFDAQGRPRPWWTEPDKRAFEELGQCVVDQYGRYEIEPGVHLDGRRVLAEAIADLAGVRVAYRALARSMKDHPVPAIDGFTPEQQFFIAWGQLRGIAESPELQRQMAASDPHATARYRVIGPLSSSPEFARAFGCKDGSTMAPPPEKRCKVW
ncbi:MAG: M13 family metallopeptidase [Acidobacteriota bacterium]